MPFKGLDDATRAALVPFGFDEAQLERWAARARTTGSNAVTGHLEPPREGDLLVLPPPGSEAHARLSSLGRQAVHEGRVGVVVLAGGMATRFGGVVKAAVPVVDGRSFLALKYEDARRAAGSAGGTIPFLVMSSAATDEAIRAHVDEAGLRDPRCPVTVFPQMVSLRLDPQGELFLEGGAPSPYATGHGDLPEALRRSGALARFRAAGGTALLMSNVDNLGATVDFALIGLHLEHGAQVTAEVVRKADKDAGGAPARVDGRLQIVEGFRFPEGFDQSSIPVFNTNTFILDAAALEREVELDFYRVEKSVDARTAIQFERLVGQLTAVFDSRFVEVPREGVESRFLPCKDPEEMAQRLPLIERVVRRRV